MTRVEEEKVTTIYEEVDSPEPKVEDINLNVNPDNDGETVTVEESTVETTGATQPQQVNINAPW